MTTLISLPQEGWTPTERRILSRLADGNLHPVSEFYEPEEDPELDAVSRQTAGKTITKIRRKLKETQLRIMTEHVGNDANWRLVRLLSQDE